MVVSEGLEFALNEDGKSYSVVGFGTCTDGNLIIPAEHNGMPVTSIYRIEDPEDESSYLDSMANGTIIRVVIPDSITSIGDLAFARCDELRSVQMSNSVKSIGAGAFFCCSKLAGIEISQNVTRIGDLAFAYCDSLARISIPGAVETIGIKAFYCDEALIEVTFHEGLKNIEHKAFAKCHSLSTIIIPLSVQSIGSSAFQGHFVRSISVPPQLCNKALFDAWGLPEDCIISVTGD